MNNTEYIIRSFVFEGLIHHTTGRTPAGLTSDLPQLRGQSFRAIGDVYAREEERHGLVAGVVAAVDDGAVEPLEAGDVELVGPVAGGHGPDVREGDAGELAAPAAGQGDGAHVGERRVAAVLGAREA